MTNASLSRRTYRRTQAEQSELEERVVRVSLRLFSEGGYEALSMRKLAAEVGVAPMSLYRYFPSKAHLMRHVWQDILERACAQGARARDDARGALPRLNAFLHGFVQYWLDNPDHYAVVFVNSGAMAVAAGELAAEALLPDMRDVLEALGEMLDECAGRRALQSVLRRQVVEELFCGVVGFLAAALGLLITSAEQTELLKARWLDGLARRVQDALHVAPPSTAPTPPSRAAKRPLR